MLGTPLPLTATQLFRIAKNRTVTEGPTPASSLTVSTWSAASRMSRLTALTMMGSTLLDQHPEYTEDANIRI
jgi:hypothetical protein